jgi:hypothetical protein
MTTILRMVDGLTGTLTAQQERQSWAAVHGGGSGRQLGGRSGFRTGTPSTVLSATSTTWTLGPCAAMLDPGAQVHQGMYGWSSDANIAGSVTAADATNPRKDIVYIQVNDSDMDTSGAKSAPVLYLAGTPGTTPSAPALPARSFLVGTISVPIAGGGSPTVVRNPAVYVAAGGRLPISSQAERDAVSPFTGFEILRTDLTQATPAGTVERYNGSGWDHFGHSEWTFNQTNAGFTSGIQFGTGALAIDSALTTDVGFVTTTGETLVIRDAGLYNITLSGTWSKPSTSRAFSQILDSSSGTTYRNGVPIDENLCMVTASGIRLAAGAVLTPSTFVIFATGSNTWVGRIRITRIG